MRNFVLYRAWILIFLQDIVQGGDQTVEGHLASATIVPKLAYISKCTPGVGAIHAESTTTSTSQGKIERTLGEAIRIVLCLAVSGEQTLGCRRVRLPPRQCRHSGTEDKWDKSRATSKNCTALFPIPTPKEGSPQQTDTGKGNGREVWTHTKKGGNAGNGSYAVFPFTKEDHNFGSRRSQGPHREHRSRTRNNRRVCKLLMPSRLGR